MEQDEWESRWSDGRIAFHQQDVHPYLGEYAERVWGENGPRRVYVPLCGKSLDMMYLAERWPGTEVVGVEFVEQAIIEFFDERGLEPRVESDPARRFEAGPYTLFAADVFDVDGEMLGKPDALFDRGSLVALREPARADLARHLSAVLPAGARGLMITFDYNQSEMDGPPFAVSADELDRLFGEHFGIEHLETRNSLNGEFESRGLSAMTESAHMLTRR